MDSDGIIVLSVIFLGISAFALASIANSDSIGILTELPDDSLVLHYQFYNMSEVWRASNAVYDSSGKEHIGIITGKNFNEYTSNDYFSFDGVDDVVIVGDDDRLSPQTTKKFSIAMLIMFNQTNFSSPGEKAYLQFMGKASPGNYEFAFRQHNHTNSEGKGDRISFYLFNLSGGLGAGSYVQEPIQTGDWVFLVGVYNGTHVELWKNGVLRDRDSILEYGLIPGNGNSPLKIGSVDDNLYFNGAIRELMIFNRTLERKEIESLARTLGAVDSSL